MALVESAGAAYKEVSALATVTSATVTATANALVVAVCAGGNGSGRTVTSQAVTSTLGGTFGTWVKLIEVHAPAGDGVASIWCADAGSSPTSGTVTYTVAPSTAHDVAIIVRQFAGANPAASQNGTTGSVTGTTTTVSITPNATGSQVVAARGSSGTVAVATAATNNTLYGTTAGSGGDQMALGYFNSLTTVSVAQLLGFSSATQSILVAAEILAAPAASMGDFFMVMNV